MFNAEKEVFTYLFTVSYVPAAHPPSPVSAASPITPRRKAVQGTALRRRNPERMDNLLPEYGLFGPLREHEMAREDEEVVGQAVDVARQQAVHLGLLGQLHDAALGAAADGACHMALGRSHVAAGNDKTAERGQRCLQGVDAVLHIGHSGVGQLGQRERHLFLGSEKGLHDKEVALHLLEQAVLGAVGVLNHFGQEADVRVELIHGAIGLHTGVELGHTGASHQRGGAFVAGLGVYHSRFL